MEKVYDAGGLTLYHGNSLEMEWPTVDLVLTDPPYATTSLSWDRWQTGWVERAAGASVSLWCFGSMRMFMEHAPEFLAHWKHAQEIAGVLEDGDEILWVKQNGSGFHNDRFRRVHEHAVHFYRGAWAEIWREPQKMTGAGPKRIRRRKSPAHTNPITDTGYHSGVGGERLLTSVIRARSMHGKAIHPTEKPLSVLLPLIRYSCPPGGLVLDPFAGSASTLIAAALSGRRAIGIEADAQHIERAIKRLDEHVNILRLL